MSEVDTAVSILEQDLCSVTITWCCKNKPLINPDKTRLNGKHGAGAPESEFRSRSLGVGARSVTSKNGKHGVQNMENTESDVKYGKHGADVKNMENTESDVLSA